HFSSYFFLMTRPPPSSTLFPYTTLFRSHSHRRPLAPDARRRRNLFLQSAECWLYGRCRRADQSHVQAVWRSRLFAGCFRARGAVDRKSTRLNSSHVAISYAVFCLKKKKE